MEKVKWFIWGAFITLPLKKSFAPVLNILRSGLPGSWSVVTLALSLQVIAATLSDHSFL